MTQTTNSTASLSSRIRTDLEYAMNQLRRHRCVDRALDALERIEAVLGTETPDLCNEGTPLTAEQEAHEALHNSVIADLRADDARQDAEIAMAKVETERTLANTAECLRCGDLFPAAELVDGLCQCCGQAVEEWEAAEAVRMAKYQAQPAAKTAECAGCGDLVPAGEVVDGLCLCCGEEVEEHLADEAVNNTAEYQAQPAAFTPPDCHCGQQAVCSDCEQCVAHCDCCGPEELNPEWLAKYEADKAADPALAAAVEQAIAAGHTPEYAVIVAKAELAMVEMAERKAARDAEVKAWFDAQVALMAVNR